jgi:uncharacterized protein (TIGR02246 family)
MTDKEAIAAVEDRTRAAYGAGDPEAVAAQYTEDAVLMRPNNTAVVGREAIADSHRGFFSNFRAELTHEVDEIEVLGDWGYMRGRFLLVATPKRGGAPFRVQGKSLSIVRRASEGVWQYARDIYNYDHPAPRPSILGALLGLFRR